MFDQILQADLPVVCFPLQDDFVALKEPGHRLIVARGGLYKEVRRQWLYAVTNIAPGETPYGCIEEKFIMTTGLSEALLNEFVSGARAAAPNETAAWIVWNETTRESRLVWLQQTSVSSVHVTVERPMLSGGDHLLADLHSHHDMKPFFSGQDDADDLRHGDVYIAGVVGHISTNPTWKFRLCLEGKVAREFQSKLTIGELP